MTTQPVSTAPARRIAGYVRVSSKEQAEDQNALEQQKARVREAGATEIYEDVLSGRRNDRPQYQRLMELVKNKAIDEVVFTRIDRLTRSIAELSRCIEIFDESQVNLRILDQNLDLSDPPGRLMARLLGAVAEWESDLISERVRHGKAYRRKLQMACESAPRGYVVVDNHYELNTIPILCLLDDRPDDYLTFKETTPIEQVTTGRTVADIARDLIEIFFEARTPRATLKQFYQRYGVVRRNQTPPGDTSQSPEQVKHPESSLVVSQRSTDKDWPREILYWTESGLRNWLTNPVLEGNTVYQKWVQEGKNRKRSSAPPEIHRDTHPDEALVTHDEAAYIRETFEIHRSMGGGSFIPGTQDAGVPQYRPYAYLNAFVYCYDCGSKCRTKTSCKGKYTYFVCPHAGTSCRNRKSVQKQKVEQALIKQLVLRSQQMRAAIRDVNRPYTSTLLTLLTVEGASEEQLAEFHRQNQPQYNDLPSVSVEEPQKSERLQSLEQQLQYAENFPGFDPQNEALKEKLKQDIEREKLQSSSLLNKSAEEIIFAGNEGIFWNGLTLEQKVDIYPRIVDRLYIQEGQVKQVNVKVEVPE